MNLKQHKRPTFYYDTYMLRAGGILLYKIVNNEIILLMIYNKGKLEDIGGRTNAIDGTIYDTIAREVVEESNNIFNKDDIKNRINDNIHQPIIHSHSKYMLFLVPLINDEYNLTEEIFGTVELHGNIERIFKWINLTDLAKNNLNRRLQIVFKDIKKQFNKIIPSTGRISGWSCYNNLNNQNKTRVNAKLWCDFSKEDKDIWNKKAKTYVLQKKNKLREPIGDQLK